MQPVTAPAPAPSPPERPAAPRGRWIWRVSGVATVAVLAVVAIGITFRQQGGPPQYAHPLGIMTRSLTVPQPVTSLRVLTSGPSVRVTAGPGNRVQVTEAIQYDPEAGELPALPASVSGKVLTLDGTTCDPFACSVGFLVTVPRGTSVSVSTAGGDVVVSGTAATTVDSGGGNVYAAGLRGPLNVTTGGGSLVVNGLAGPLDVETSGGSVDGSGLATAKATVITEGGDAWLGFASAPGTVVASTDNGTALLAVPLGPYALTADSGGGPQVIAVATDPAAPRSITVTSGGGPLEVEPSVPGYLPPISLIPPIPPVPDKGAFGPLVPPDLPVPPMPPGS
jgi:hypothetical protein